MEKKLQKKTMKRTHEKLPSKIQNATTKQKHTQKATALNEIIIKIQSALKQWKQLMKHTSSRKVF